MNQKRLLGLASVFTLVVAVALVDSCSTVTRTVFAVPEIPGAHFVGNNTCADCHATIVNKFPASPHARIHLEGLATGQTGCESCHGAGSLHVQSGSRKLIFNPGKDPASCFQCHLETHAEFSLPQHHPVLEGKMSCSQCHDPHGGDIMKPASGLAMARLNESCAECHREQTRPMTFEHEAMREGCATCHNPHGSVNRKLLAANDSNLCLRCHVQNQGIVANTGSILIGSSDHTAFLRQGSCWTSGCHTAVHGSNVDPRLLY